MDPLEALLDGPRARGAFLLRSVLDPPWALRIEDEAPLTLLAVVRGWAWLAPHDGAPLRLEAGDIAVARGPGPYAVADDPATPPSVVIGPGQVCSSVPGGRPLAEEWDLGVRTWGPRSGGATVLLTGTYERAGELGRPLLAALPPVLTLRHGEWDSPLVTVLADEVERDSPGQRALLDRLLDVVLIAVLRTWFSRKEEQAPGWYRALADPVVGTALRLLQNAPAHPWTVSELAARTGVSRAALARRFAELVGEPPMSYLTGWRLALAADLLRRPDLTVGAVARQVGYSTAFALSAAFKREHGISPAQHRERAGDG